MNDFHPDFDWHSADRPSPLVLWIVASLGLLCLVVVGVAVVID